MLRQLVTDLPSAWEDTQIVVEARNRHANPDTRAKKTSRPAFGLEDDPNSQGA